MKPMLLPLLLFANVAAGDSNTVGSTVAKSRPVYFSPGNTNVIGTSSVAASSKRHGGTRIFELRSTLPPIIIPKNYTTKIINNETVYEHVYPEEVQGKQKFGVRKALRQGAGAMSALLNTVSGGLAAVGGGFLLYATMLGMFGENFLNGAPGLPPLGSPLGAATLGHPGGPIAGYPGVLPDAPDQNLDKGLPRIPGYPPIQKRNGEWIQPRGIPQLRVEEVKMLRQAMEPFMSTLRSLKEVDYPEQIFRVLHVDDFECKQRTICEIEQYLAGKGVAGFLLNFLSPRIPGMDKYHNAIATALRHQNCGVVFRSCPETIGQRLLRIIGIH
ncbi:uncharacterized protein LOC114828265 [Galendromus occidentalis]|uniref:Uncharacterized protein LOC114828265 n=1 Tax=Galendromus occidentalis TaxID=34638 RepID=A0AAJ7SGU8_9ACAR|nr:uncharacterized protein LOC114828265 [Galendromus occidentalis]